MANPVKGETPLVLSDGREFTLVLDNEALLSIEDTTGKPLHVVMAQIGQGYATAVAAFAQAAFGRHHPEMTRADVVGIVMGPDRPKLEEALSDATERAFPEAKAGNAPAPKAKPQRGKSSGRNGAKRG